MSEIASKSWDLIKLIAVPLCLVLGGFVWNFNSTIVETKTKIVYLNTRLQQNELVIGILRDEILALNSRWSAINERTIKSSNRIDEIVNLITKNLAIDWHLGPKIDGFRDEVE